MHFLQILIVWVSGVLCILAEVLVRSPFLRTDSDSDASTKESENRLLIMNRYLLSQYDTF